MFAFRQLICITVARSVDFSSAFFLFARMFEPKPPRLSPQVAFSGLQAFKRKPPSLGGNREVNAIYGRRAPPHTITHEDHKP